jgi:Ca-activated chloride channel family protein
MGRLRWCVVALFAVGVAVDASQDIRTPLFRSNVDLTTVTATVLDKNGALVGDLPREAFDVYEDGRLQPIAQFTNERVPISLAVLLDVSDSMYGQRIKDARAAVNDFVTNRLDPADEFAIMAFNHRQKLLTSWTEQRELAAMVMQPLRPFGSTAIYDAIVAAVPLANIRTRQRGALLVISDGADTASDLTIRDVRTALLRSDAFVYAVAIDSSDRRPINAAVNPTALSELTDQSGGRTSIVHGSGDLGSALATIADELNSQYLIGYSSPHGDDGQYHSIRVRVRGTDHRVRARNGYVAEPRH